MRDEERDRVHVLAVPDLRFTFSTDFQGKEGLLPRTRKLQTKNLIEFRQAYR